MNLREKVHCSYLALGFPPSGLLESQTIISSRFCNSPDRAVNEDVIKLAECEVITREADSNLPKFVVVAVGLGDDSSTTAYMTNNLRTAWHMYTYQTQQLIPNPNRAIMHAIYSLVSLRLLDLHLHPGTIVSLPHHLKARSSQPTPLDAQLQKSKVCLNIGRKN